MHSQLRLTLQQTNFKGICEENAKLEEQLTSIKHQNLNLQTKIGEEEDEKSTIESKDYEPPKMKRIGGGFIPPNSVVQSIPLRQLGRAQTSDLRK
mmetsp:Transcript_18069/g.27858  ORF Transcript_18069/g.27858 Transcript_18069/m.27858 type:complete len:95 (+) Transcript_18069:364-648(+)